MSFGDHLEDLRRRLILGILGLVPIVIISLIVGKHVLAFLAEPLQDQLRAAGQPSSLIQTGLLEAFGAYLKLSMVAAVLVGSPWVLYQLWKFIAPGLYAAERKFVHLLIPLSTVLTISSAFFLYFAVLPIVMAFFIGFGTQIGKDRADVLPLVPGVTLPEVPVLAADPPDPQPGEMWINTDLLMLRIAIPDGPPLINDDGNETWPDTRVLGAQLVNSAGIVPQIKVSEYLGLLLSLALAFAIAFQTPVVVLLLGWAGIVERKWLAKYRRYALLVAAVLGAVLTPADPVSMIMMAGALYLLFELGMILLVIFPPGGRPKPSHLHADRESDQHREPDGEAD